MYLLVYLSHKSHEIIIILTYLARKAINLNSYVPICVPNENLAQN